MNATTVGIDLAKDVFARVKPTAKRFGLNELLGGAITGATFVCGLNRSMQHTEGCLGSRSVADEVPDKDPVHGSPEGPDVGPMATRRVAAPDCATV